MAHRHTKKTSQRSLPTEMIIEILLKLPVESLLRCKSVCKSWCSLVSDPCFVKSHLTQSTTNRMICNTDWSPTLETCDLRDVAGDKYSEVDYPLKSTSFSVALVGSCNGLLCLYIDLEIPCLWNPVTRKMVTLSSSALALDLDLDVESRANAGFGYDHSTNDYKLVEIHKGESSQALVMIYSLRNGSWKDISATISLPLDRVPHNAPAKFFNGALHWAHIHWVACERAGHWTIISFDLATETFGQVMTPVYDEGEMHRITLGTLGEWFSVLCFHQSVDLWVMKVYGVKESWTKLVSIPYMDDYSDDGHCLSVPLSILNDGKILLAIDSKFIIYDPKKRKSSQIQTFCVGFQAWTFVESLVSPMPPPAAAAALGHQVAGCVGS